MYTTFQSKHQNGRVNLGNLDVDELVIGTARIFFFDGGQPEYLLTDVR
jgi:hypothetical protein